MHILIKTVLEEKTAHLTTGETLRIRNFPDQKEVVSLEYVNVDRIVLTLNQFKFDDQKQLLQVLESKI